MEIPNPTDFQNFVAGFVAVVGNPNAGKSTLINTLLGEKLVAVSGLPQTTRDRINAIYTDDAMQAIFVDTPGLTAANDKLNESLRYQVFEALEGVDCVLHVLDATDPKPMNDDMADLISRLKTPVILGVNKIDTQPRDFDLQAWLDSISANFDREWYQTILGLSAIKGIGKDELLGAVAKHLTPGPPLYDPDELTDRDLRFLSAELIREKVFQNTHQELPYATAVTIEQFSERAAGKWYIAATIHLERDSQKGMVIGKGGSMLKKISRQARVDIEDLCGTSVFLDLHVKVSKNWRKSDNYLRSFGYERPPRRK